MPPPGSLCVTSISVDSTLAFANFAISATIFLQSSSSFLWHTRDFVPDLDDHVVLVYFFLSFLLLIHFLAVLPLSVVVCSLSLYHYVI